MSKKRIQNDKKSLLLKRRLCIYIGSKVMSFYSLFRECAGVKTSTENTLKGYKNNEKILKKIEDNVPALFSEIDKVKRDNRYYKDVIIGLFGDMRNIRTLAQNGDVKSIIVLLSKYELKEIN